MGACYQGAHLTYKEMDCLDSDALGITSSYSTRGSRGIPSQTFQNLGSLFVRSRNMRSGMFGLEWQVSIFPRRKRGCLLPAAVTCICWWKPWSKLLRHLKVKSSLLCLFTGVLSTGKIRGKDKSFKLYSIQPSGT